MTRIEYGGFIVGDVDESESGESWFATTWDQQESVWPTYENAVEALADYALANVAKVIAECQTVEEAKRQWFEAAMRYPFLQNPTFSEVAA